MFLWPSLRLLYFTGVLCVNRVFPQPARLVYLVYLVCLVFWVERSQPDELNEQEKPITQERQTESPVSAAFDAAETRGGGGWRRRVGG